MELEQFTRDLLTTGRVQIATFAPWTDELGEQADEPHSAIDQGTSHHAGLLQFLTQFESEYRLELPADPPDFRVDVAEWAARRLYRACQFVLYRDLPPELIEREFSRKLEQLSPSVHYSIDLIFRFLPDVYRQASSASNNDTVVDHLRTWAVLWPLSSVGISNIQGDNKVELAIDKRLDDVINNACLLRLYCDRIIANSDRSRLENPQVREHVHASLGLHSELAPAISQYFAMDLEESKSD